MVKPVDERVRHGISVYTRTALFPIYRIIRTLFFCYASPPLKRLLRYFSVNCLINQIVAYSDMKDYDLFSTLACAMVSFFKRHRQCTFSNVETIWDRCQEDGNKEMHVMLTQTRRKHILHRCWISCFVFSHRKIKIIERQYKCSTLRA